jgi:hypothetical protein
MEQLVAAFAGCTSLLRRATLGDLALLFKQRVLRAATRGALGARGGVFGVGRASGTGLEGGSRRQRCGCHRVDCLAGDAVDVGADGHADVSIFAPSCTPTVPVVSG